MMVLLVSLMKNQKDYFLQGDKGLQEFYYEFGF